MNYAQGSVLHRSAIWGKRATFVLGNEKIFTSGLNRRDFLQKSSDVICFDAVGGFGKFSWSFVNTISNQSHEKFIELNHFHSGWYFPKRFVYGDSIMHFIYGFGCMRVFFFSLLFWIFKIPQRLQCWMFFAKLKFTDLRERANVNYAVADPSLDTVTFLLGRFSFIFSLSCCCTFNETTLAMLAKNLLSLFCTKQFIRFSPSASPFHKKEKYSI